MRATYLKLQSKLAETQTRCELLLAQHRRARTVSRATQARAAAENATSAASRMHAVSRLRDRVEKAEANNSATPSLLASGSLEERFATLEKDDRVEQLLADLKSRQQRMLATG